LFLRLGVLFPQEELVEEFAGTDSFTDPEIPNCGGDRRGFTALVKIIIAQ